MNWRRICGRSIMGGAVLMFIRYKWKRAVTEDEERKAAIRMAAWNMLKVGNPCMGEAFAMTFVGKPGCHQNRHFM